MIEKSLKVFSFFVEGALVLGSAVIVGMVTTEVILRKLFGSSLIFTEELARYLMVWIVFLGSVLAIRDGAHIRISFFVKRFSDRVQIWIAFIAHLLTVLFLVILTAEGIRILPRQLHQMCITFDVSMFYFYLSIPLGCVLMILFLVPKFRDVLGGKLVERDERP
jgi:TRAP-type C4-dicarboxylate transport system permease small subunit